MASARILAVNAATLHENRIHSDEIAAVYGFQRGLVPGVSVYGYMTVPVVDHFGEQWLDHGWMHFRLAAPFYDGEMVVAFTDGATVSAHDTRDRMRAAGTVGLHSDGKVTNELDVPPRLALPVDRPLISEIVLSEGMVLGSIQTSFDHNPTTEDLLSLSNDVLVRNFVMPAWVHVGSEVHNWQRIVANEPIEVRATITRIFEKKGHNFLSAGVTILNRRGQPAQTVRHTAIWRLHRADHRAANS